MATQPSLSLSSHLLSDFVTSLRRIGVALVESTLSLPLGAPVAIVAEGPGNSPHLNARIVSHRPAEREDELEIYFVRALSREADLAVDAFAQAASFSGRRGPATASKAAAASDAADEAPPPSPATRVVELTELNVRELSRVALGRRGLLALGEHLRHGQRLRLELQRDGVEVAQLWVQVTGQVTLDGQRSVMVRSATEGDRARLETVLNSHGRSRPIVG